MLKCPRDGTALQEVSIAGVQLDKCHRCDGIWCDPGELERLRDLDLPSVENQLETRYGNPDVESGEVTGYMRCPRCEDGRLQGITVTYTRHVRVDRCETCLGFWLDKRELDLVVTEPSRIRGRSQHEDEESESESHSEVAEEQSSAGVAGFIHRLSHLFRIDA